MNNIAHKIRSSTRPYAGDSTSHRSTITIPSDGVEKNFFQRSKFRVYAAPMEKPQKLSKLRLSHQSSAISCS
ncbi:MAG: hypothetical protein DME58_05350 [Verrucomicrobia bacterium]|nr:MAG: hypothetical protein DME58_05350 [Verrucomicrobiota bacterium]